MENLLEALQPLAQTLFAVDSMGSVILRAVIWFVIAIIIIISADKPNAQESMSSLKANLGFFLMFIFLGGGLIYLLFGFSSS